MRKNCRGAVPAIYLVVAGVAAIAGLLVAKPKFMSKDSKRAEQSTETTSALIAAEQKKNSVAAASVVKIGEANAEAPESKQRDYIAREVLLALGLLPAPDAQGLIDAEKRKVAVMEGKYQLAQSLYDKATANNAKLVKERDEAIDAKRKADLDLERAAAERLGMERQRNMTILAVVIVVVLYGYTKFTHFSPQQIGEVVADIKKNVHPLTAIDTVASRYQQKLVNKIRKLKADD